MKYTRTELINSLSKNILIDEDVEIDSEALEGVSGIHSVKSVHVIGNGFFDPSEERFYATLSISGLMICPDSITGEDIEHPFETDVEEIYSFENTDDEDVIVVDGEIIDLLPQIVFDILLEVPLSVTHASPEDYPSGDGWRVITEEEYQASLANEIDPRLAKLKEFKND